MTRIILRVARGLLVFRVCGHVQFTSKDRQAGERYTCWQCTRVTG
jgi:hypothetical protein